MNKDESVCFAIVNNIPSSYHACDLRNFFSQFLETKGFSCFHFRHRPEVQKPTGTVNSENLSRRVTTCCVIKVYEHRYKELIEMYDQKHWLDRDGNSFPGKCFIKKIFVNNQNVTEAKRYVKNSELSHIPEDREIFTHSDLLSLIELKPPVLMPNGNVGTPTTFFLDQIKTCRLPPSIITKLKLEFPKSKARRIYSSVDYNYGGRRLKSKKTNDELIRTFKGDVISKMYVEKSNKHDNDSVSDDQKSNHDEDEESDEEEEWDRHETLHNDVTSQERLKERLFEDKIELKWEKGGSGLVFYTDAQIWDKMEGDFDAKTADDWDIDTSIYYEPGAGDKDARDLLKMRLEDRLRSGNYSEKVDVNDFAGFEKYSKGFGRKVLESQGWKQGEGVGKKSGISEPIFDFGQHPRDKKGFGYRGEKLQRNIGPKTKTKRRRRYSDSYEDERVRISTVYDNPIESDPAEPLLRSSFLTKLAYRKEFLKEKSNNG